MGKVSMADIKATAPQRAFSFSNMADATRQLAASNKKIEIRCHRKAAQGSGRCVARNEKAIRFGYSVCPAWSLKNSAFSGNRRGFRIFRTPGREISESSA